MFRLLMTLSLVLLTHCADVYHGPPRCRLSHGGYGSPVTVTQIVPYDWADWGSEVITVSVRDEKGTEQCFTLGLDESPDYQVGDSLCVQMGPFVSGLSEKMYSDSGTVCGKLGRLEKQKSDPSAVTVSCTVEGSMDLLEWAGFSSEAMAGQPVDLVAVTLYVEEQLPPDEEGKFFIVVHWEYEITAESIASPEIIDERPGEGENAWPVYTYRYTFHVPTVLAKYTFCGTALCPGMDFGVATWISPSACWLGGLSGCVIVDE